MRMAGEQQNLVRLGQFGHGLEGGSCPLGIEVDEHIVEDDGKRIRVAGIVAKKREPYREVELLRGTAAEQMRKETHAVVTFHLNLRAVERRDNTGVPAVAHGLEESRSVT